MNNSSFLKNSLAQAKLFLLAACICLLVSFINPAVIFAEDISSTDSGATADGTQSNYCSKYDLDPTLAFLEDTFDRETFIGVASTTKRGVLMDYLLVHPGSGKEGRKGEVFDIVAFTPKVWYSHHPTQSTMYVAISRGVPVDPSLASTSTPATSTAPSLAFVTGQSYVVSGNLIKSASSSSWSMSETLDSLLPDSDSTRVILNNACVAPTIVTSELYNRLGQPLVSFDKYEFTRTLGLGMSGNDVRELNILLKIYERYASASSTAASATLMFDESKYFGKKTRSSLIKYQETNAKNIDIRVATGFFGEKTLNYVNQMRQSELNSELSCAKPTFAKASSTTAILYDLIPAEETLVSGELNLAQPNLPDKTVDLDLGFVVDSISSSTPDILRVAKKSIVAQTASLDLPLSQVKVGTSTWFIPHDNVKDFSSFIGRNSVSKGKISRISYYSEEVPLYFPQSIACGRVLR